MATRVSERAPSFARYAAALALDAAIRRKDHELPLRPLLAAMGAKPSDECVAFCGKMERTSGAGRERNGAFKV